MRRPGAIAILAVLAACGGPDQAVRDASESALSWAAGVEATAEAWGRQQVTARFARAALESAVRGLEQERAQLTASPRTLADGRVAAAAEAIGAMSALVARMRDAVGKDDSAAVEAASRELQAAERRLRTASGGGTS
jgi:hypothetical protein